MRSSTVLRCSLVLGVVWLGCGGGGSRTPPNAADLPYEKCIAQPAFLLPGMDPPRAPPSRGRPVSESEARAIAMAFETKEGPPDMVLVAEAPIQRDFGWVFGFEPRGYRATKNPGLFTPGSGPVVVERRTGCHEMLVPGPNLVDAYEAEWRRRQASGGR